MSAFIRDCLFDFLSLCARPPAVFFSCAASSAQLHFFYVSFCVAFACLCSNFLVIALFYLCCEVCGLVIPLPFRVLRAPVALLPMLTLVVQAAKSKK